MASSIVSSIAKELGSLAAGEVKSLYQVKDKIQRLQRTLEWMEYFLEEVGNQQHQQKGVKMWVSEITDLAYEAQDIMDKYLHQVSYHRQDGKWNTVKWVLYCLHDAKVLHHLGDQIDDLTSRISDLTGNLQLCGFRVSNQLGSSAYNLAMMEQRRTYSHIEENPIGLETHIKRVVNFLVNKNEAGVVGIWGTGGVGKTTLTRQVFNNEVVKKHFENNCVWVYISKQFERKNIFEDILHGLSNSTQDPSTQEEIGRRRFKKPTQDDLPKEIKKVLTDKKCLVVLDDMWEAGDWDTLKPAFESINESSSKILITTRNKSLVERARGHPYSVGTLSPEDSWKLLQRILSLEEESSGPLPTFEIDQIDQTKLQDNEVKNKKKLAKEMLTHCNGLPLAITTLGGLLLSKKTVSEWKAVQKDISNYLMDYRGGESNNQGLLAVLELSYYDLPYYLKPCFLYMGMFPEDHEIEAEELFHLWEGEGFVTSSLDGGGQPQEVILDDIAEKYLNQLVERSMVQVEKTWPNGRIKSCRLHDIMRDMCLKKCKEGSFLSVIEHDSSTRSSSPSKRSCPPNGRMRRCSLHDSNERTIVPLLDPDLSNSTPCIRSVMVFAPKGSYKRKLVPKNKMKFLSQLRVLYISEDVSIPKAQRIVRDSIHLRFLRAGDSDLTPSLRWKCSHFSACFWQWKYLETLDLRGCEMFWWSIDFRKLERLRHLYLPQRLHVSYSGKFRLSSSQLGQIETLKNFDVRFCEIEDLQKMKNLRNFSFSREVPANAKALEVLLKSPVVTGKRFVEPFNLDLRAEQLNEDPSILSKSEAICIETLEVVGRIDGSVFDAQRHRFPHSLNEVILKDCEISTEGITVLGKLPRLNRLELRGNAIEGKSMNFSDGSFPCLVFLTLDRMKDLEEWVVGEGTCPSLVKVDVRSCKISTGFTTGLGKLPCLKHLKLAENAFEGNRMSFSDGSFPCLKYLKLCKMETLEEWVVGEGTCPSLEKVDVESCKISTGFTTGLGKLPCLKDLKLVENAFEGNRMSFSDGSFPCLHSLYLSWMENRKEWEMGEGTCPSLEEVHLGFCEISTGVITALGKLPCLRDLHLGYSAIKGKGNSMSFSDGSFPCLEYLGLLGMENLEEWEVGEGTCPSLRHLGIWDCRKLKLIPEGLPNSLTVMCSPCVNGSKKYGGCKMI